MKTGTRIGLAVGFGYLLGRRRKLRTALTLAAAVAAGRASRDPGGLLKRGTDALHASPQLSNLGRLGGPLVNAGRAAATAAAGSGVDALTGRLRNSADALRRRSGGQDDGQKGEGNQNGTDDNGGDRNRDDDRDDDRGEARVEQRRGR
ncbi:hypothetical protein O7634_07125 [Micromonospora sp. WMMD1120]|uniref:hypothetical protein n=1 Tax=Micromonospora sp. WMMD1120 TaxID=3016106 RepID=UPI002417B194|nr:hypothetical protein [Micromonospora sp. WMMD1120]MDG4806527.1 hypothetical protein [Micromonospora sp. WMMD1120]